MRSRTFKNFYFCALDVSRYHEKSLKNAIKTWHVMLFDEVPVMFVMFGPESIDPPNEKSPQNAFFLRSTPSRVPACSNPGPRTTELYRFIKYLEKNKSRTFTNFHSPPCLHPFHHVYSRINKTNLVNLYTVPSVPPNFVHSVPPNFTNTVPSVLPNTP